ncbi:MAG: molybdenum cofactor guanylyltransferase [Syntrophales bacterium]|nr:molybdenum cofactor guanylyltransferase [Syntrophales bacterium]MDD5640133.1 molybdenum cofactor guanylyltransferase [Syntrophales bacterium]
MRSEEITGAILAGGRSRRLGRDKVSLPLAGKPLAWWAAEAISPWVSECWLVTNQPLAHASLGLPLITDLRPGQGPLGGLETALFYARTPLVLAVAADTPFLAAPLLAALAARAAAGVKTALVCQTDRGLEPFPGIYAVKLLARLTTFLQGDDRHVRHFLEQCRAQTLSPEEAARLDPQGRSFLNLNTPEDFEAAARLAAAAPELSPSS